MHCVMYCTVLQAPFLTVVPPATPDQAAECDKAFKLINFCPTATDLDLKTLGMNGIIYVHQLLMIACFS